MKPNQMITVLMFAIVLLISTGTIVYIKVTGQKMFLDVGQYNDKYNAYTDEEMLYECEKYELIYDYDNAECVTISNWNQNNTERKGTHHE